MKEVREQAEVPAARREPVGVVEVVCELAQELARVEELLRVDLKEVNKEGEGSNYNPFADFFGDSES